MSYEVGVLKATDKERVTAFAEGSSTAEDEQWSSNFQTFEGVLKIDGEVIRWKAYTRRHPDVQSDCGVDNFRYDYHTRIDLAEWRKRKDAKAIRTVIREAITAEAKRLESERAQTACDPNHLSTPGAF
jgi:hypothetical protein